jgi:hypothetical protein
VLAHNFSKDARLARGRFHHTKDRLKGNSLVAPMSEVFELKDERINEKCAAVREKLIAFEYHNQEMTKAQVIKLCSEIINAMFDILELTEE